ncbi:hypothetical protein SteCoe_18007 [Stentor coeruleus]|uniref:Uncharacterized protein n=1 Tax=Stentor coeruleus TaxID=5963 RepID=A0A1R2AVA9_9CILI|nr:hypothetical protein SteCoe_34065 [Stentor coeruleus]OMJ81491.1 hypothetical protein SteCoe_18007 [Stentor coeruleus]
MTESNIEQNLDKPLIYQNDEIDICNSSLSLCSCLNRMIYEYNKPHNRVEDIILTGFPEKWIYNHSIVVFLSLLLLCFIPFVSVASLILMILFLQDLKKKYNQIRSVVKKPWKNMLVVDGIPMTFSFATFTKNNLHCLYDNTPCCFPTSYLDDLHSKIEKELLERPVITVCSSAIKTMYKSLNSPNSAIASCVIITLLSTGSTLGILLTSLFFRYF